MKSSIQQLDMPYYCCPKKHKAREQTIIETYRKYYGRKSIPGTKQYWTICGRCYDNNKMAPGSEPGQLIQGLIKPSQFFGVEINPVIHGLNQRCNQTVNWIQGDFYSEMIIAWNHKRFNPAIVNADMTSMPKRGSLYLSRIMNFLTDTDFKIMLIGNFVMQYRSHIDKDEDVTACLESEPLFQASIRTGKWKIYDWFYRYNGTGRTGTKMGTVIMFKCKK